ncbi:hypothetical protein [Delftia sp. HK171]|uniref:hypothetical protein n=1 Tax=Delftia sp. HK171 TaxID=1920191 RepID=UPI0011524737|nr:hypothetical protein [Delftia sp. HK171]TQL81170.1 hypothetical protein FB549_2727 [Delftia sp. HK171]
MHDLEIAARGVVDTWEQGNLAQAVSALDCSLQDQNQWRLDYAVAIARAREIYCSETCLIDTLPLVAPSQEGTFVAAWLWVPNAR